GERLLRYAMVIFINGAYAYCHPVEAPRLKRGSRIDEERRAIGIREADADAARLEDDVFEHARARIDLHLPDIGDTTDGTAGIIRIGHAVAQDPHHLTEDGIADHCAAHGIADRELAHRLGIEPGHHHH